jgi:DNA repair ATPase RecN
MKKVLLTICISVSSFMAQAQSTEAQQLLLNVEKLAQFKKILQDMYDGYKILYKGYTAVKDISKGNFNLHKNFLDALLDVSPAVRKYKRIADVINYQSRIVKEYKAAFARFKEEKNFTPEEVSYLKNVYEGLLKQTAKSIDELVMVVTAGTLRMSDDERLQAVDKIYDNVLEQFSFLKEFNNNTGLLAMQRKAEQTEITISRRIDGVK